ncbi:MAG: hypothetical protein ACLRFE_03320 [Clostridia bacterium]
MQNILIVCVDADLRKGVSKALASKLGYVYVDIDDVLNFELLNNQSVALTDAAKLLRELQRKSIERVLTFSKCIVTMSNDLFIANNNFMLFNEYKKIFLFLPKAYFVARGKNEDKYRMEQDLLMFDKLNKIVSLNCDICIDKSVKTLDEISNEIILNINNN